MPDNLQMVMVDGLSVNTTEQGAQAIKKLLDEREDQKAKLLKATDEVAARHNDIVAAKDKEIAAKDAEIEKLRASQLDAAKVDDMVEARVALLSDALRIFPKGEFKGKDAAEIRKIAVEHKLGEESVKDRSEDYIAARFDILLEDAPKKADPVRSVIRATTPITADNKADVAYAAKVQHLGDAWKGDTVKEAN